MKIDIKENPQMLKGVFQALKKGAQIVIDLVKKNKEPSVEDIEMNKVTRKSDKYFDTV